MVGVKPLRAKIGLKEGIEGGDKFEVLEIIKEENGQTRYERRGVITVDSRKIWDNRFDATDDSNSDKNYTYFRGVGDYYPGMLLRQIK